MKAVQIKLRPILIVQEEDTRRIVGCCGSFLQVAEVGGGGRSRGLANAASSRCDDSDWSLQFDSMKLESLSADRKRIILTANTMLLKGKRMHQKIIYDRMK